MHKKLYLLICAVLIGISGIFYLIRWNNSNTIHTEFIKSNEQSEVESAVLSDEAADMQNTSDVSGTSGAADTGSVSAGAQNASGISGTSGAADTGSVSAGMLNASETPTQYIYVYVCGYVNEPGVYKLDSLARMYEAIEMAGGVSEEGCVDYLELAQGIYDGQRIYVPSYEQVAEGMGVYQSASTYYSYSGLADGSTNSSGSSIVSNYNGTSTAGMAITESTLAATSGIDMYGRVNINYATREELMTLNGIGDAKAAAIIEYRETYGSFASIEELMNVSGIKQTAFDKIKDYICV